MTGNSLLVFGVLIGAGFLTLAVVLLAVAATVAVLHAGATHHPAAAPSRATPASVPDEERLFAGYVRGEIDAAEYHRRLAAADRG